MVSGVTAHIFAAEVVYLKMKVGHRFYSLPGSRCGFPGHRAHPGEQGSQDAPAHVPGTRQDQPLHELPVPHRDDPHGEGADRAQARGGSRPEEKGTACCVLRSRNGVRTAECPAERRVAVMTILGHLWNTHEKKLGLSEQPHFKIFNTILALKNPENHPFFLLHRGFFPPSKQLQHSQIACVSLGCVQ